MDTISIPWKKTITDPFGNPHEITETFNVPIEDIWKWQQFYIQNAEYIIDIETGETEETEETGKTRGTGETGKTRGTGETRTTRTTRTRTTRRTSNKRNAAHTAKIKISRRIGYAENDTTKKSKTENIDFLIEGLREYTDPLLAELIDANLDRLRDISKMPEASEGAKKFLHKLLK